MAFIPAYILILLFTITMDYIAGLAIEKATGRRRKAFLIMSLVANVGTLAVFKYLDFLTDNTIHLISWLGLPYNIPPWSIILPIGLSFHTFQSMSYTIEVYFGRQPAEKKFGIFALYVMFYPQLVAGPIERPQHLLPQFRTQHFFEYRRVTDGLKLMAWGLFKKVVIADKLAVIVNPIYDSPQNYNAGALIVATVFFAYQIYCDFSGYSDIAIGSAQVMGFKLMNNFKNPYGATSISEFWKRWHISLSTWFRDYLYIPLGGNRVGKWRHQFNLLLTFLVSGLWHGASWTFVIWGALHGLYLIISTQTKPFRQMTASFLGIDSERFSTLRHIFQRLTVLAAVCLAWIFFRAKNTSDAIYIVSHIFGGLGSLISGLPNIFSLLKNSLWEVGLTPYKLIFLPIFIIILETAHFLQRSGSIRERISHRPLVVRWALYYGLVQSIFLHGVFSGNQFIYFQF